MGDERKRRAAADRWALRCEEVVRRRSPRRIGDREAAQRGGVEAEQSVLRHRVVEALAAVVVKAKRALGIDARVAVVEQSIEPLLRERAFFVGQRSRRAHRDGAGAHHLGLAQWRVLLRQRHQGRRERVGVRHLALVQRGERIGEHGIRRRHFGVEQRQRSEREPSAAKRECVVLAIASPRRGVVLQLLADPLRSAPHRVGHAFAEVCVLVLAHRDQVPRILDVDAAHALLLLRHMQRQRRRE